MIVAIPGGVAVSIGSVTGADTYDGTNLHASQVLSGGAVYDGVVVTESLSNVVSIAGDMPTAGPDTYSSATNRLAIPAVQVGSRVYTNVVVSVGKLVSVTGLFTKVAESVLASFNGGSNDGSSPSGLTLGIDGNFYGTTASGGPGLSYGTVFTVTPAGVKTILYFFKGGTADGAYPNGDLLLAGDGNFYGTTAGGGACLGNSGCGTFFKVTSAGSESLLHSFGVGTDLIDQPFAGLTTGKDGNFYGTSYQGGNGGNSGSVYTITPAGVPTLLYSFQDATDGVNPVSALVLGKDGNFYGTTYGDQFPGSSVAFGTLFKVTPAGSFTLLHAFQGGTDGAFPVGDLIQGSDGNFYGTTSGYYNTVTHINNDVASDFGTIFQVTPAGAYKVIYAFRGGADGSTPMAALTQAQDGNFYGTTYGGDTYAGGNTTFGTAFKLTPTGIETVLYTFGIGSDGASPAAPLIRGNNGLFYGTTVSGFGAGMGGGTVFSLQNVIPFP